MKASEHRFFRKGIENQKKADIKFSISAPDAKEISKWTTEQKLIARDFINDVEVSFNKFKKSLIEKL